MPDHHRFVGVALPELTHLVEVAVRDLAMLAINQHPVETLDIRQNRADDRGSVEAAISPSLLNITHVSQKPMPFSPFLSAFLSVMRACIADAIVSV